MKKLTSYFLLSFLFVANLSCGGNPKYCFQLVEQQSTTIITIEKMADGKGQLTIVEEKDGVEVAPPMTTPGTFQEGKFKYPDGTTLTFDDEKLTWPENALLAGSVFEKTVCK